MERGREDGNQLVALISRSRIPSHQQRQRDSAVSSYVCERGRDRERACACEGINLDAHVAGRLESVGATRSTRGHACSGTPSDPGRR